MSGFSVVIKNMYNDTSNTISGCENEMLISELKVNYAQKNDILNSSLVYDIRFVCGGAECKENETLGDLGISHRTPIDVVCVVQGGEVQ